jgi:hypothetical protein
MSRLDVGGQSIIVNMADGTYPAVTCYGSPVGAANQSSVVFTGNSVDPAACVIHGTNTNAAQIGVGAIVSFDGIQFSASGSIANNTGTGLLVNSNAQATFASCDFGVCAGNHMWAFTGGLIGSGGAPYSISGSPGGCHILASNDCNISVDGSTLTINNAPTWGNAFIEATSGAFAAAIGCVFNGPAHGKRWAASANGVIGANATPDTYFPGDINGVSSTGGIVI